MFHPPITWLLEGVPVAVVVSGTTQWHSSLPTGVKWPRFALPPVPSRWQYERKRGGERRRGCQRGDNRESRHRSVSALRWAGRQLHREIPPGNGLSVRLLPISWCFLGASVLLCLVMATWRVQCKAGGGPDLDSWRLVDFWNRFSLKNNKCH